MPVMDLVLFSAPKSFATKDSEFSLMSKIICKVLVLKCRVLKFVQSTDIDWFMARLLIYYKNFKLEVVHNSIGAMTLLNFITKDIPPPLKKKSNNSFVKNRPVYQFNRL